MKERRRAPRIAAKLPLKLRLPGQPAASLGETLNLSVNGIYFRSAYFMEEGTKLPIKLALPMAGEAKPSGIEPEGIVVRCVPEQEDSAVSSYEIACYFMSMDEADTEKLAAYLAEMLAAQKTG